MVPLNSRSSMLTKLQKQFKLKTKVIEQSQFVLHLNYEVIYSFRAGGQNKRSHYQG